MSKLAFTIPTLSEETSLKTIEILQGELSTLNDLSLVLKHAHWNVAGPAFIAVHELLDPHIDEVRDGVDEIAERIQALGGSADGRIQTSAEQSIIAEYPLVERASTTEHLKALDAVYVAVETQLRADIAEVDDLDLVSSNILQDQLATLEAFQWKVRSHLV